MDYAALIAMISKAVGNTGQAVGGIMQYDAQGKAIQQREETMKEEERRQQIKSDALLGQARAKAGASGLSMTSGSISSYLGFMEGELNRQAEWTRQANERELSEARTARDWQLGGTIFSWFTGGGSEMGKMFSDVSQPSKDETSVKDTSSTLDVDYLQQKASVPSDLEDKLNE
jgi:hypothetical protein